MDECLGAGQTTPPWPGWQLSGLPAPPVALVGLLNVSCPPHGPSDCRINSATRRRHHATTADAACSFLNRSPAFTAQGIEASGVMEARPAHKRQRINGAGDAGQQPPANSAVFVQPAAADSGGAGGAAALQTLLLSREQLLAALPLERVLQG